MADVRQIDLLALIGADIPLKKVASTQGGEFAGPCPLCGGTDRFLVWPSREHPGFWCRQCEWKGDAITYVRVRHDVGYNEAVNMLQLQPSTLHPHRSNQPSFSKHEQPQTRPLALEDDAWQACAQAFVINCAENLQHSAGREARQYLRARGLTDAIIEQHWLGYNAIVQRVTWGQTEVYLPKGIIIPWQIDGKLWSVKIRQLDREPKYMGVKGNANGLYRADQLTRRCIAVMVEGEFDALSLLAGATQMVAQHRLVPVATGSAAGAQTRDWVVRVAQAHKVILAFDADEAGDKAAGYWQPLFGSRAVRLKPAVHDINDMLRLGYDLEAWLRPVIDPA